MSEKYVIKINPDGRLVFPEEVADYFQGKKLLLIGQLDHLELVRENEFKCREFLEDTEFDLSVLIDLFNEE